MPRRTSLIPYKRIEHSILLIRGMKVILDRDLAELYGVETFNLNKAVRRNSKRFPPDFMFQLTSSEYKNLIFQNGISRWGGTRKRPYAFSELGVAMLSSVLKSERAVHVNIQIMRAFVSLREILTTHKDLAKKLDELEKKYDQRFQIVFETIRRLIADREHLEAKQKNPIGFRVGENTVRYKARLKRQRVPASTNAR